MARKLTQKQLMADPKYMLAWLRTKKPRDIITRDLIDNDTCIGAMFLRENGYPNSYRIHYVLAADWFAGDPDSVLTKLPFDKAISVQYATKVVLKCALAKGFEVV